jgi:hypothetical protein
MKLTKPAEKASESTRAWWKCPGLVYFLEVGAPQPIAIKIGMLAITPKNPNLDSAMARRLASIQSGNHQLVRVRGIIHFASGEYPTKEAEDCERRLHIEFAHLARFKANARGAEWFSAAPELLRRIQEIAQLPEELGLRHTIGISLLDSERDYKENDSGPRVILDGE